MNKNRWPSLEEIKNSAVGEKNAHLFSQPKPKKKNKYGASKKEVDGIMFDSEKEARRYGDLKMLQKAGLIGMLELQKPYELHVDGEKIASYIADFVYLDAKSGLTVVEDVKSEHTRTLPVYRLKRKLMKAIHGIIIQEV